MSTLHRVAEAAVLRDLHRATGLLRRHERLGPERRNALVEHLVWMTALTEPTDPRVSVYAGEVRRTAHSFATTGERDEREALLGAIDALASAASGIEYWTAPAAVAALVDHLPWLLDGVVAHPGPGLLFRPQGSREAAREAARTRAAAYRRTRSRLWGAFALTGTRTTARSS